jgi:hypothetical protein
MNANAFGDAAGAFLPVVAEKLGKPVGELTVYRALITRRGPARELLADDAVKTAYLGIRAPVGRRRRGRGRASSEDLLKLVRVWMRAARPGGGGTGAGR